MDPLLIRRPSDDEGWRRLIARLDSLEQRLAEVSATLGSQGAVYTRNGLQVSGGGSLVGSGGGTLDWSGPAHLGGDTIIDGTLTLAAGIIGAAALDSQISATSQTATNTSWQPGTAYANAVSTTLARPAWATSAIIIAGGYIAPKYNVNAGSPHCYGRVAIQSSVSPSFISFLGSLDVPAGLAWPFMLTSPPASIVVATQGMAPSGVTVSGGSASVSAVALWLR